jgi:signal transduction histidine kinase
LIIILPLFFILYSFGIVSDFLFNILNFIGILIGIWMVVIIIKAKLPYTRLMALGFIANLIGTLLSVFMLILLSQGVKHLLVYDYPFVFVKIGVLIEIFFFNIAIFKKWHDQEKQLLVEQIEKQLAIEKVRNQISSSLHDDIGSTLSGIAMYSHLTGRQLQSGDYYKAIASVHVIQKSANEIVDKLSDLVWAINPKQDSFAMMLEKIKEYGQEMCHAKKIRFKSSYQNLVLIKELSMDVRRHVYLFAKEAINNAVKYSAAMEINFEATVINAVLTIAVTDNGKGFDADKVLKGNGLDGMEKRAEEMGAAYVLKSKIGEGTSLSMQLKIPQ